MPNQFDSAPLQARPSRFQPLRNKRPYENTDNYQNHMKINRIDPRTFSVYDWVVSSIGTKKVQSYMKFLEKSILKSMGEYSLPIVEVKNVPWQN